MDNQEQLTRLRQVITDLWKINEAGAEDLRSRGVSADPLDLLEQVGDAITSAIALLIDRATGPVLLPIKLVRPGAEAPRRMTPRSAGLDMFACLRKPLVLESGVRVLVPTGFAVKIPEGFEGQCRPRSGLALRDGITVLNSPGTVDEDYVGEMGVILINHSGVPFTINHGDRIAQLVITPTVYPAVEVVDDLPTTMRGAGGFGSTGK